MPSRTMTPNEGSVWVVLCWMAPSFPPNVREKVEIFDLSWKRLPPNFFLLWKWTLKKNFPLRGPGFGGMALARQRARGAREAREARYVSLYLLWPCLYWFPKDSTLLRVFAHSTRASGVVIFNKNFATFQVSKTNEKNGVFALSTRPSEGVLLIKIFATLQIFSKIFATLQIFSKIFAILQFFSKIFAIFQVWKTINSCRNANLDPSSEGVHERRNAKKCEKMRKKVQLYKCKSVHHIKLFL